MKCPFCKAPDSRVVDTRAADDGATIRRRRECVSCGKRFTTYESLEKVPMMVIKSDGRRETFDRNKLLNGLIRSCDKRDIETDKIVALASQIEQEIRNTMEREVKARSIGERVMEHLKDFDEVAYIRFASVYRKFRDVEEFKKELDLLKATSKKL